MVDKAFLVDVEDLQELCGELKNYSLRVSRESVTITRHDGGNGLNDISFIFPIVADLSILQAVEIQIARDEHLDTHHGIT